MPFGQKWGEGGGGIKFLTGRWQVTDIKFLPGRWQATEEKDASVVMAKSDVLC